MYFSKFPAIELPLSRTDTKRDGSCPSVSNGVDPPTFSPSVNTAEYFFKFLAIELPLSRTYTKRDGSRPTESIHQHFTPFVNTSVYFYKSLMIGLPLSPIDTKRDGSCPSISDGVALPTFYTLCKQLSVFFWVPRQRTPAQSGFQFHLSFSLKKRWRQSQISCLTNIFPVPLMVVVAVASWFNVERVWLPCWVRQCIL